MLKNFEDLEQWHSVIKGRKEMALKNFENLTKGELYSVTINRVSYALAMISNLEWLVDGIVTIAKEELASGRSFDDILISDLAYFSNSLVESSNDDEAVVDSLKEIVKVFSESVDYLMKHGAKLVRD